MALSKEDRRGLTDEYGLKKFGKWWDWEKPVLGHSIGPNNPHAFDVFSKRLHALRTAFRDSFASLTDEELLALGRQKTDQDRALLDWFKEFARSEIQSLNHDCPIWLASGFGHPEAGADFEYWGQMARYSLHEVLMLSVGVEPEMIAEHLTGPPKRGEKKRNPPLKFLLRRRTLLEGHFPSTQWGILSVSPNWVKCLIDEIMLEVHPEFYRQLERRLKRTDAPVQGQQSFTDHERQSYLKLIAAMSAEQYDFDPKNNRNTATAAIESDLNCVGLSLDRKTILKHLRDASEKIDPTYWAKD